MALHTSLLVGLPALHLPVSQCSLTEQLISSFFQKEPIPLSIKLQWFPITTKVQILCEVQ
jgi:hypothetical protein